MNGVGSFTFTGDVAGTIDTDLSTLTSGLLLPGIYTVTESVLPPNWMLTDITNTGGCSADLSTKTVTITLLASNVTCTFANTFTQSPTAGIMLDPPVQVADGSVEVVVTGGSLVANAQFEVILTSHPVVVFRGTANSNGGARFVFVVPDGTHIGLHTLTVRDEFGNEVPTQLEVVAPPVVETSTQRRCYRRRPAVYGLWFSPSPDRRTCACRRRTRAHGGSTPPLVNSSLTCPTGPERHRRLHGRRDIVHKYRCASSAHTRTGNTLVAVYL